MRYKILGLLVLLDLVSLQNLQAQMIEGYRLVWNDEFDHGDTPDTTKWEFEEGYKRNHEWQCYQKDNARIHDGILTITARLENGRRVVDGKKVECTSSSINTRGKFKFLYGRMEVRARIPFSKGAWPAIWLLGSTWEWPSGGEIDVMEFYHKQGIPHILANFAYGTNLRWNAAWRSKAIPYSHFLEKDPYFSDKFHVWRMDWDEKGISIYLDDELLNQVNVDDTRNQKLGDYKSPFRTPQYILLNLAMGGDNGGEVDMASMPVCYDIDYVRVYKKN